MLAAMGSTLDPSVRRIKTQCTKPNRGHAAKGCSSAACPSGSGARSAARRSTPSSGTDADGIELERVDGDSLEQKPLRGTGAHVLLFWTTHTA